MGPAPLNKATSFPPTPTHLVRHQHARRALEDARVGEALPEDMLSHVRVHGAENVVPGVLVFLCCGKWMGGWVPWSMHNYSTVTARTMPQSATSSGPLGLLGA